MKEQLISFETAKLAKEKGFINGSLQDYRPYLTDILVNPLGVPYLSKNNIMQRFVYEAPTQSLLQKWLREVHKIDVGAYSNASGYHWDLNKSFNVDWFSGGTHIADSNMTGPNNAGGWDTYEEALEIGLQEALKLIK